MSVTALIAQTLIAASFGTSPINRSAAPTQEVASVRDMICDSVAAISDIDVAVTDIYAPSGTVDSGTVSIPWAQICNYGTSAVTAPVVMRIGDSYLALAHKWLDVGGKDTVSFAAWTASPAWWQVVSCSTALEGDDRPENDRRLDSVMVRTVPDAATLSILTPTGYVDSGVAITPAALVGNNGTSPAPIPVRMRIGTDYESTAVVFLQPGAVDTVRFAEWVASPAGLVAVSCSTRLVGDRNDANDWVGAGVIVGTRIDAACIKILAPLDTVDSGDILTPTALIANNSTSTKVIPVLMRIGADYFRSRHCHLGPGLSDTVRFPEWQAHPRGGVAVACSVALNGDEAAENNAIRGLVHVCHHLDAATQAILAPVGAIDSGHVITPKARVANHGVADIGVPVELRVGDQYRSTRIKIIPARGVDTVHFDDWTALRVGRYAVRCSTRLDGDDNPANDCQEIEVNVDWRDAACPAITSPAELARAGDTIIPHAWVCNHSTVTTSIPAVFRAGSYACEQTAVDLGPGDSTELSFPPLVIPAGSHAMSCSTALTGDMHTGNNRCVRIVYGCRRQLSVRPDSSCVTPPGGIVTYQLICSNDGNAYDTIDICALGTRLGWTVELLDSADAPLGDANSNGVPDIGPLPAGTCARLQTRLTVPLDELGLVADSTSVRATSGGDVRVWDRSRLTTTVSAIANLMIGPDQYNLAPPAQPCVYRFIVTNLGNAADFADIEMQVTRNGWHHELLDGDGKPLGDRNNNGRRDIGPVAPRGGEATLQLAITPDGTARLGHQDTTRLSIQSFLDPTARDFARAVTEVSGSITELSLEPDHTASLNSGDTLDLELRVRTAGSIPGVVNLDAVADRCGWQLQLCDSGGGDLRDTDFDGRLDLGTVWPDATNSFLVRVIAPGCASLAGRTESLTARVRVLAALSGRPTISDSAVIVLTPLPRFEIHNHANPFSDATRFFYSVPRRGRVSLVVYSRLGERVRTLVADSDCRPGVHVVDWDGTNEIGLRLAPGVYVYVFELTTVGAKPERILRKAILKR